MEHVPEDYWLKGANTRCLLAAMVHHSNKEVVTICSALNPGQTQENQRRNAAARVQTEREETSLLFQPFIQCFQLLIREMSFIVIVLLQNLTNIGVKRIHW